MKHARAKTSRERGYYGPSLTDVTKGAIVVGLCGALAIALMCAACVAAIAG